MLYGRIHPFGPEGSLALMTPRQTSRSSISELLAHLQQCELLSSKLSCTLKELQELVTTSLAGNLQSQEVVPLPPELWPLFKRATDDLILILEILDTVCPRL